MVFTANMHEVDERKWLFSLASSLSQSLFLRPLLMALVYDVAAHLAWMELQKTFKHHSVEKDERDKKEKLKLNLLLDINPYDINDDTRLQLHNWPYKTKEQLKRSATQLNLARDKKG